MTQEEFYCCKNVSFLIKKKKKLVVVPVYGNSSYVSSIDIYPGSGSIFYL